MHKAMEGHLNSLGHTASVLQTGSDSTLWQLQHQQVPARTVQDASSLMQMPLGSIWSILWVGEKNRHVQAPRHENSHQGDLISRG